VTEERFRTPARLAIADPPYLGRGALLYGPGANGRRMFDAGSSRDRKGWRHTPLRTTEHPDAGRWDDPDRHRELVRTLVADYDGWAIAAAVDSLPVYLSVCPPATRICAWVNTKALPTCRVSVGWEAVLAMIPPGRTAYGTGPIMRDVLIAAPPNHLGSVRHVGAKPAAWTRFVLNLMGYDPTTDTVDDLFPGSGGAAAVIAQGTLL
jgi:hypothetical protein